MDPALFSLRALAWLTSSAIATTGAVVGLTCSAIIRPFSRRSCYDINSFIAGNLWRYFQWLFTGPHKARITFSGDALPEGENAIVIANHTSYSDFQLIHSVASSKKMQGRCRYFAKDELKYIPILGWAIYLCDMVLVSRNWITDQKELLNVFGPIRKLRLPMWLITYVEGTRFTPKKCKASQEFCESRNKPILKHVLYPRVRGFYATVEQFRTSHIKVVYDLTLVWSKDGKLHAAPTPVEVHGISDLNKHYKFHVHVRRFNLQDLPQDEAAVAGWLEKRWVEKDQVLEAFAQDFEGARKTYKAFDM
ncbi:hypothetical protein BCR37DRAFT_398707 [Protomyces lactucae-debilis]|uniref:Phospholipid/glycerol acyltransferase domain-containing protein n=1 Tax=Protomyces lactucae-debilis TaxID=2754530 RepID=A0A1Y2FDA3_PROLT|nr:uncharacterized protein BCR37DRAFT_398707 [Protomyces lactucae-debilis]ORY81901.1 hypothetical protein BCR37DRAFT_398707 [Protomyces lactucae-debilis]